MTPFGELSQVSAQHMQALADGGWVTSDTIADPLAKDYTLVPALVRYRRDGSVDFSFGKHGQAVPPLHFSDNNHRTFVVGDGSHLYLIVSEKQNLYAAAFLTNGRIDPTYGDNGVSKIGIGTGYTAIGAAMQDGKVLISGSTIREQFGNQEYLLVRLTPSGQLDPTFADAGMAHGTLNGDPASWWNHFSSVAVAGDGKIVAAGMSVSNDDQWHVVVARFGKDGVLDGSFGQSGFRVVKWLDSETPLPVVKTTQDGKIVVAGTTCAEIGASSDDWPCFVSAARLMPNGSFDTSFGIVGKTVLPPPGSDTIGSTRAIAVDAQGRIVIGGAVEQGSEGTNVTAYLSRLHADGSVDQTFGDADIVYAPYCQSASSNTLDMAFASTMQGDSAYLPWAIGKPA